VGTTRHVSAVYHRCIIIISLYNFSTLISPRSFSLTHAKQHRKMFYSYLESVYLTHSWHQWTYLLTSVVLCLSRLPCSCTLNFVYSQIYHCGKTASCRWTQFIPVILKFVKFLKFEVFFKSWNKQMRFQNSETHKKWSPRGQTSYIPYFIIYVDEKTTKQVKKTCILTVG